MSERVTTERVRELLAVDGTRRMFGGVLMDAALVRDLAADLLDARTVASEAIAAHDALDVAARELLTATLARDTAHTAHTNAGPSMRRAAMDALCDARGRYTRAVEAAARVVDGTTTRAEVPRG